MNFRLLSFLAAIIAAFYGAVLYVEAHVEDFYAFNPTQLHNIAKQAIANHGNDTRAVVTDILGQLQQTSGKAYINMDEEWIFNNAGGAMGGMYIVHASVTEYLLIFGTAIGTEGHTGRHTADDYFHIIRGEQTAYLPGEYEPEVYPQGSVHHLKRGVVKQYKMDSTCFALEYARGWIPPMFFFGFADGLTSTLDLYTLWRTTYVTCGQMIKNMLLGKL